MIIMTRGYHFIDYVQQNNEHAYYHNDNMTHEDFTNYQKRK